MPDHNDKKSRILFVDDEQLLHGVLERLLGRHGIAVTSCSGAVQAVKELKNQSFDMVITDFKMPKMDGLELLAHVRQHHPCTKVIMITAHANVQHAVKAMKGGVVDYIPKPFATVELAERVQKHLDDGADTPQPACGAAARAVEATSDEDETSSSETDVPSNGHASDLSAASAAFVGEHESVEKLKSLLPRVARSKAPVFIYGESGTGKEILAKAVHEISDRASEAYVTINCANLPRELVESHLFGHVEGAFTGATGDMTGAFEKADSGTLLLDEITEIEPHIQAKLLRVLQEGAFQKVGAASTQDADVRVIATSNRDLEEAVENDVFREDLYHRLAVFPLHVPPLRERLSDIPLLVDHFIDKYCELYGFPTKEVASDLMSRFQVYDWPGNVRQLENMVHRGVVLAADSTTVGKNDVFNDFFTETRINDSSGDGAAGDARAALETNGEATTIEAMERRMILRTLNDDGANQREAADRLGISARTIRNKLRKYRKQGYDV
jgi:DNA-binding NtrC family response regulator